MKQRAIALILLLWMVAWAVAGLYGAVANPLASAFKIQGPDTTGNAGYPLAVVPATGSATFPVSGSLTSSGTTTVTNLPTTVDTNAGAAGASTLRAVLATGGATIPVSGTIAASNLPTTADTNAGAAGASTLRTVLATGGATIPVSGNLGSTTTGTPADAFAAPGAIPQAQIFSHLFNGTTWDQTRTANSASATPGRVILGEGSLEFDETNWQKRRDNTQGTALASAARTGTTSSSDITNFDARGVTVYLSISAASGTGGLQVSIDFKDPVTGNYTGINALPTAVTTATDKIYSYYPGATAGYTTAVSVIVPKTFRIRIVHGDSTSYTYSVGYCLIL